MATSFSENQQADKSLENKLKPWEKEYITQLHNKLRTGSQSVTAADSVSVNKMQETMQEFDKNQNSRQILPHKQAHS